MQPKELIELEKVQQLYKFSGFVARYTEILQDSPGLKYSEAYEQLEAEYESIFGYRRFMSYDSFRITRRYHKNQTHYIK